MKIKEIKNKLFKSIDLSVEETTYIFSEIMNGNLSEIETSSILIALKLKNETKNEILGASKIMREKSLKINAPLNSIDTCGTGGDMKGTLNISTAAAIVTASAGAYVAKHGNRSISSKSGSADVLEKLGIKLTENIEELHIVAKGLLEYETLTGDEINDLIKGIRPSIDDFDNDSDSVKPSTTSSVPKSTNKPRAPPQ